jgi:hypothetical protein
MRIGISVESRIIGNLCEMEVSDREQYQLLTGGFAQFQVFR